MTVQPGDTVRILPLDPRTELGLLMVGLSAEDLVGKEFEVVYTRDNIAEVLGEVPGDMPAGGIFVDPGDGAGEIGVNPGDYVLVSSQAEAA